MWSTDKLYQRGLLFHSRLTSLQCVYEALLDSIGPGKLTTDCKDSHRIHRSAQPTQEETLC